MTMNDETIIEHRVEVLEKDLHNVIVDTKDIKRELVDIRMEVKALNTTFKVIGSLALIILALFESGIINIGV